MKPILTFAVGTALFLIGILKVWLHMNTATTLMVPGCLGTEFVIRLSATQSDLGHCWGCYVALAGLFIMLGALIVKISQMPAPPIPTNGQLQP